MGAGIVTIGRRAYALGLYWENSPGSGSLAQTAREAARQPSQKSAFFATRGRGKTERVPQFGLGQGGCNYKVGMPVLSACLANQQPGSWVGAFRTREGTIVIVVRDDMIVPDGDQLFIDEIEARDRLLQEIGFGGLQRIFAPESWSIPGADTMPLSLLLNDNADIRLQPVEIPKEVLIGGAVFALLLAGGLSFGFYWQAEQERIEMEQAQQAAALARAQMEANRLTAGLLQPKQIEYPPPERMWEKKPLAINVIEGCRKAYNDAPMAYVGWKLEGGSCSGSSLSMTWRREAKSLATIPEGLTVFDTGTEAASSVSIPELPIRDPEDLMNPVDVTQRVLEQNWGVPLGRAPADPPPPPPPGYTGEWNPPEPPWLKRSFTLDAPILPWTLSDFFRDFPGLVVTDIRFNAGMSDRSWTINGVIYENRR